MTDPASGPGGRPSKYDPAFCDAIVDFMAQGYSVTAFAGSIRVARSTVYLWAEEHPEFSDALQTAQAIAALWWENRLRDVAERNEGNATAAIFGLKNRAADDWRDKQAVEHTGRDGGPIQTENLTDAVMAALKRKHDAG
jgi:hypothetical protein